MAGPLDAAEFRLPVPFPGEYHLFSGAKGKERKDESDFPSHVFPNEFPYDSFDSALSSETETDSSDEDDFFVGLSRRLNRSSSQKLVPDLTQRKKNEKSGGMATSPQSTLSGVGSWSFHSNGSSRLPSRPPSPPITPIPSQNEAWDLIYATAGENARLKMNDEAQKFNNEAYYAQNQTNSGFYSNQNLASNLYQSNQIQRQGQVVKPQCGAVWGRQMGPNWQIPVEFQQLPVQRVRNTFPSCENNGVRWRPPLGLPPSSWPVLRSNSTMKAVFLGGSNGAKRECAGTGVFLPRTYGNGNPSAYLKKTGSPPVLVPAKVVQALNLNLDEINGQSQPFINAVARRNAALLAQQML